MRVKGILLASAGDRCSASGARPSVISVTSDVGRQAGLNSLGKIGFVLQKSEATTIDTTPLL
jgi:hypothetical protein